MYNFTINPDDKFYPNGDKWMWNYCIFLGKFTDSKNENYDLGIHIILGVFDNKLYKEVSDATVHGNNAGNYTSGELSEYTMKNETREWKLEVWRRANILNLI